MKKYFLNRNTDTNPNNDHEVHKEGCHIENIIVTTLLKSMGTAI